MNDSSKVDPSKWVSESKDHDLIKHWEGRQTKGFSEYDWWNFCDYLAWVNIQGLEKFKDGRGHPADLGGMDEWKAELDVMIDGFKAHLAIQNVDYEGREELYNLMQTHREGMALYAKRFSSLWD